MVDDDPITVELLQDVLTQLGARVVPATGTEEAIRAFAQRPPDLIISDIAMPERDGCQFLRMVRARTIEHGGATPAIALSGRCSAEDRARAMLAGFQVYLAKPATAIDLAVAIETALASVPQRRA